MFLFILESIGMQELVLIGAIALIVFGPRKLPQMARTVGKVMAEFRKATSDFKETWEREVDFESIKKDLDVNDLTSEPQTIAKSTTAPVEISVPEIKEVRQEEIDEKFGLNPAENRDSEESESEPPPKVPSGKQEWL